MEKDILNILLEYKKISDSKKEFRKSITEALTDYGFVEKSKGIVQGLDKNFATSVEPFIKELQVIGCKGRFTSGRRQPGKNSASYHITGRAMDMTFDNDNCYCKAMDICSRYTNLFCLDERKRITQDWTAPHLHVSVPQKSGKTVACNPKSAEAIAPQTGTTQQSSDEYMDDDFGRVDTGLFDVAQAVAQKALPYLFPGNQQKLQEGVKFGRNTSKEYNDILIPASDNKKILSPINGKVVVINDPNCVNSVGIRTTDGDYTIKYCNIDVISVSPGDRVSAGALLGYTGEDDVLVSVLDITKRKKDPSVLDKVSDKQGTSDTDTKNNYTPPKDGSDDYNEKYKPEQTYQDAGLAALFGLPFLPFKNRYDKKTGELIKKNWGSPTEKRQPDKSTWFRSPTDKKLSENIERIKKLLN
jgi:hypothetical protein